MIFRSAGAPTTSMKSGWSFFGDGTAMFEAFKAGELNTHRESNAAKWDQQFSFPRVTSGDVIKAEIPHDRPTGISRLCDEHTSRSVQGLAGA